ncbi:extracellular solute-binding protein [Cohnella hashimotonis]|uniref:Extracellular solute-binding protein n=1 Tax=Cohnella hashimotonis TaxID=2826895 RepID=A0ABT6TNJ6_9BACL|nr:extracellular solute-binding protein [Cohnella hashimotonis]MDI4648418.1 extracellular solute-binding protein [Cohnella hashimotonis]
MLKTKKRTKRTAVGIGVMAFMLLAAGCGGNDSGNKTADKTEGQPTSAATASDKGDAKSTEQAKALKDLKITRLYHGAMETFKGADTINSNRLIDKLREASGFNIQYEALPLENPSQKISIIFASGDVPDIMTIAGKSDYFKLAKQGALEPLDDLIAKEMPNVSNMAGQEALDAVKFDGKIYAIPYRQAQKVGNGLLARTDVLKELGLKEPGTLDEFYETMKTIKEKKNIAPLSIATSNPGYFFDGFTPFAAAFGVATPTKIKDGKLVFSWVQPEYKEFLETMKKWYDEGLLDQEFAIKKGTQDTLINGTAVFTPMYWGSVPEIDNALKEKKEGGTVGFIAPPVGKNGESGLQDSSISTTYIIIPKQAKNKLGAAQYLNFLYTPETDELVNYGIEGTDYTKKDGVITQTPEQSANIPWRSIYPLGDTDAGFAARLKAKGLLPYYEPLLQYKKLREETNYAPSVEAYDAKFTELRNYMEENSMKFIMGKRSLSEFDSYVKDFNAKGGQDAIDAMNAWFASK